jgi:hypothetical protein
MPTAAAMGMVMAKATATAMAAATVRVTAMATVTVMAIMMVAAKAMASLTVMRMGGVGQQMGGGGVWPLLFGNQQKWQQRGQR